MDSPETARSDLITLAPEPAASPPAGRDSRVRLLGLVIAALLVTATAVAVFGSNTSEARAATEADLALIQSAGQQIEARGPHELEIEFDIAGMRTTMFGRFAEDGSGVFEVEIPGFENIDMIASTDALYLPSGQEGKWVEFTLDSELASVDGTAVMGDSGIGVLENLADPATIRVLGTETFEGTGVTRYRATTTFDRLAQSGADVTGSETTLPPELADSEVTIEVLIDDAGALHRLDLSYDGLGSTFETRTTIRSLSTPPTVEIPSAAEIDFAQSFATFDEFQQAVDGHMQTLLLG